MEAVIWVLAILAVVVIVAIYVITSVKKYSDSFVGKYIEKEKKDAEDLKTPEDKNKQPPPTRGGNF